MKKTKLMGLVVITLLFSNLSQAAADKAHHLGVFVGLLDAKHTETMLGLEYEYRFNPTWGTGLVFEKSINADDGDDIESKLAALYYHPGGGWRLGIGLGEERSHGHTETLQRASVAYDFHLGSVAIAPSVSVDRVHGHTNYLYGVAAIISF